MTRIALYLLRETITTCVFGEAFYYEDSGKDLVRFCVAKYDPASDEAYRRLARLHSK